MLSGKTNTGITSSTSAGSHAVLYSVYGYDPETGKIDIDKVEGRTPKSDRDKLQILINTVKDLQAEFEGNAPISILKQRMVEDHDLSEEKTEEIIKKLKSRGVLFEPSAGNIKTV